MAETGSAIMAYTRLQTIVSLRSPTLHKQQSGVCRFAQHQRNSGGWLRIVKIHLGALGGYLGGYN